MKAALFLGVLMVASVANAQGTFGNLNFELANVPFVPVNQVGADVATSLGLPGWSAFIGSTQVGTILHNNKTLGSAEVVIFGPQSAPGQILQGNYSVLLGGSGAGAPTSASISEVGQIPANAKTVSFFASPVVLFQATFGGQALSLVPIGSGANYVILGADISRFAGQTGELDFIAPPGGGGILDNIQFSPIAIPEPSAVSLAALAGLALFNRSMMTNRRSPLPLSAKRKLRCAVRAQRLPAAAVAYVFRWQ